MADPVPGPVTPADPESVQKINAFFAGVQKVLTQVASVILQAATLVATIGAVFFSHQASQQGVQNEKKIEEHIKLISKKP